MPDPDLEMGWGGGVRRSSRLLERGGGPQFFGGALRASIWSENKGERARVPRVPLLDPPLSCRHNTTAQPFLSYWKLVRSMLISNVRNYLKSTLLEN